ncbi:centromere protein C-like isoform X2 [Impatiens glandulifera]|uniref:centromere protein C-like isoform X2 n=1 Tax=Impatiens glandulifera TaxID=253017 RepID=UPI001FB11A15|nr:centromere protein C-like isoform X2 [Impatiens glandulifera]
MKFVDGVQSSDLMDPLHHFSSLSLFPRAFSDLKKNVSSYRNHDGLDFIHESMKSKDLKSPNKLFQQANTIIDGVSGLLNTNINGLVEGEKLNDTFNEMRKGNPQDRRPGLGRKRPCFSLKPNSSQSTVSLEPSLDIDQFEDPEDYFLAYEKLENVRKELRSQKGSDLYSLDEHSPLRAEQRRRPGLLRKSTSYIHHGPSIPYEKENQSVASQETSEQEILLENHSSPEKQLLSVKPGKDTSSVQLTRPKVDGLLDELLSDKCENLDGNGALSFLQEHLQIKPIDLEKLCLPAFPVVGKGESVDVKEKSKKPKRVLSDIQNILKSVGDKTPMKDKPVAGSPISSTASPTPPRSPFASIFLMKNTSLQSSVKSHDTLMSFGSLPAKNDSHVEHFDQRSNQFDSMKDLSDLDMMEATQNEHAEITVDNRNSPEIIECDSIILSNKCLELEDTDHARQVHNESILMTPNDIQENAGAVPQQALPQCQHDANVTKDSSMIDTNDQTEEPNEVQENAEDQSNCTVLDAIMDLPTSGISKSNGAQLGKVNSAAVSLNATDEPIKSLVKVAGKVSKQNNIEGPSSLVSRRMAKRKAHSRRQSLADAGTCWTSGVRRSKRIKTRPLEYWKGERFLYGRVHKSLTSVIGIKYISPAKGGGGDDKKPTFRVKSFSDEHRELVELAALH